MLYAFTYGDPDGNGQDDTYGLTLTKDTVPLDIIQTWFELQMAGAKLMVN